MTLFALPPGVDFAAELVRGLAERMPDARPEDWAQVVIYANSPRMARAIRSAFETGTARMIPRLRLVTGIDDPALPPAVPGLRRQLDLARLVAALIDTEPGIAPRDSAFALAEGLAALMAEMQDEGIDPAALATLDVTDQSGHWARALRFLAIVQQYTASGGLDAEGRRRLALTRLAAGWEAEPPAHPVVVAGSTGSRGTTALLIETVARLPRGWVVLPGFDFDLPAQGWDSLADARAAEDHPQYRFRRLADRLGIAPGQIARWTDARSPAPARNRLVSLSLRPAPVTDRWISEGPELGNLAAATAGMVLAEAPSPRIEAEVIALRLRAAVAAGQSAVLITPDRMLTRQVTAALDRWRIVPDDSAGQPLPLSPPGRFLRQIARLRGNVTAEGLVSLLKHPLCHSGAGRGDHVLNSLRLERRLRSDGPPYPDAAALAGIGTPEWRDWLGGALTWLWTDAALPLADYAAQHLDLAGRLAAGSQATGTGGLWDEAAGRKAREVCDLLQRHADAGGAMDGTDYAALFDDLIAGEQVRQPEGAHPLVRILGPREARECVADLVILGGLNDGTWPGLPAPDPWLNRAMRLRAGLLLPERQIGLAAHDYQQAMAAGEVWITRALKSDSAETVPSRWIARLTNLLSGLPAQGGPAALDRMRTEGRRWIAAAQSLSLPAERVEPEPRPSPSPPADRRPKRLSVSSVETLLRDPYAVYAGQVLRLRPLDPLTTAPDAALRGTILHRVFEEVMQAGFDPADPDAAQTLLATAERVLDRDCPWPAARRMWLARLARVADWFVETEHARRERGRPQFYEQRGQVTVGATGVDVTAEADRIDLTPEGAALIYDYKTGTPPTEKQQRAFDKQLLIEAAMASWGAFGGKPMEVAGAAYIGLGSKPVEVPAPLADHPPAQIWAELAALLTAWADPARGYTARMAVESEARSGDFDHLSRFGEWDGSDDPSLQVFE
jgi:ATP-dependent helicase/nuclease subunit B